MDKIEHIFYINLDQREDRRQEMEEGLKEMELFDKSERFPAISHQNGAVGCILSHLEVLKIARERGYNNCLILEDDYDFIIEKSLLNTILNHFFESIESYDVLMLGVNLPQGRLVKDLIIKLDSAQTASSYIINKKYYDLHIELLENSAKMLEKTNNQGLYAADQIWKLFMPIREFFCFTNRVGKQRPSYSDIEKKLVDYNV
jgi:glycosyl transferase family 25